MIRVNNQMTDVYLKGAVIDSKGSVDKNTLRTGTLSWEDIENKADYTSGGSGISYTAKLGGSVNKDTPSSRENSRYDKEPGTNTHNESDKVTETVDGNRIPLNERGLLGVPSAATKGKADSTTRAAMAPGKIIITDTKNQKQDVIGLDRNTRDSLNKLKTIFDKTKAEERKQLVEEMSIVGNEAIHELAARNGWGGRFHRKDRSPWPSWRHDKQSGRKQCPCRHPFRWCAGICHGISA